MYTYITRQHDEHSACRSAVGSICQIQVRVCDIQRTLHGIQSYMRAPIRAASRRVAAYFPRPSRRTTMQYVYFHSAVTRCAG